MLVVRDAYAQQGKFVVEFVWQSSVNRPTPWPITASGQLDYLVKRAQQYDPQAIRNGRAIVFSNEAARTMFLAAFPTS